MSELRCDPSSGAWVIVSPRRGNRPRSVHRSQNAGVPVVDPTCPFCPGNESLLPGIVTEVPAVGPPGWQARVVPNKFPAVDSPAEAVPSAPPLQDAAPASGIHEVIVEGARHDLDLSSLPAAQLTAVIALWRDRCRALLHARDVQSVVLFRNRGRAAGASLLHPHSQLIALSGIPPAVRLRQQAALAYYEREKRCVLCDIVQSEGADGTRVVFESSSLLAAVPFAASGPFEVWLVPKRHLPDFTALDDGGIGDLAGALAVVLRALDHVTGAAPYNLVLDTAPKPALASPCLHWRLRLLPRLETVGGFELGSGLSINPSRPEDGARALRAAMAEPGSIRCTS